MKKLNLFIISSLLGIISQSQIIQAACPVTNSYPFTSGCPLSAVELNSAINARLYKDYSNGTPVLVLGGALTIANLITTNQLLYVTSTNHVGGLATGNNGVLVTNGSGVPSISGALPSGISATNMNLTTPSLGVATAMSINGNIFTTGTGTLTLGSVTLNAGAGGTLGSNAFTSTGYLPLTGGTLTGNLIWTDNTYDIGANGATRPRTGYFGTSLFSPLIGIGTLTPDSTLSLGVGSSYRLSNLRTDISNGEWYGENWDSNVFHMGTYKNGAGSARNISIDVNGVPRINLGTTGISLHPDGGSTWVSVGIGSNVDAGNLTSSFSVLNTLGTNTYMLSGRGGGRVLGGFLNNTSTNGELHIARNADALGSERIKLKSDGGSYINSGFGFQIGAPTGGDKGDGTLNLSNSTPIYVNGTSPTGTGGMVQAISPALISPSFTTPSLGVATAKILNVLAAPPVTIMTSQAQKSSGSTLLPFSTTVGIVIGATVTGDINIPTNDQVTNITTLPTKIQSANGSFLTGQPIIPMATTAGFEIGQQCKDTTKPTAISAGNVILSIQTNISITLTSNTTAGSQGAADSITCDPVVTLATTTSAAVTSGINLTFTSDQVALSALNGDLTVGNYGVKIFDAQLGFSLGQFNGDGTTFGNIYVFAPDGSNTFIAKTSGGYGSIGTEANVDFSIATANTNRLDIDGDGGIYTDNATGGSKGNDTINVGAGVYNNGVLAFSPISPTIASGGCSTGSAQSLSANNGSLAFEITLGGATCGSTITLTMPTTAHNWVCDAHNTTTPATQVMDDTGAISTTVVVLTNYSRTLGTALNFTGAEKLKVKCSPY